MPVHALLEATAKPGRLDAVQAAARRFVDAVRRREPHADRVEAFTLEGTRTLVVHLVFADALAAEDHRSAKHTREFTEHLDEACEAVDLHALEPVQTDEG